MECRALLMECRALWIVCRPIFVEYDKMKGSFDRIYLCI